MKTKTTKLKLFGFIAAFAIITIGSVALSLTLAGCDNGSGDTHSHDFSGGWQHNETQHWKVCPKDNAEGQKADHAWTGDECSVCHYDRGGTSLNKTALMAKIADANAAKAGVTEAADADEVAVGGKWATAAELAALNNAITAAETALSSATTQAAIDSAVTAFNTAVTANGPGTNADIKSVSVGAQSGTLTEGTAGDATFTVTTANIASGTAIELNNTNSVAGITLGTTATSGDSTNVSINTTAATPQGSHPLTLTIDGTISNAFNLAVSTGSGGDPECECNGVYEDCTCGDNCECDDCDEGGGTDLSIWQPKGPITSLTAKFDVTRTRADNGETEEDSMTLDEYLKSLPDNTAAEPYTLVINIDDLGGTREVNGSLGNILYSNRAKYVSLDLSGSTFTAMPLRDSGSYGAFERCSNITEVTLPGSVTNIANYAFEYCSSLTQITIPASVTNIGGYAFGNCGNLASVTFEGTIPSANFSSYSYTIPGDLRAKFYAGAGSGVPGTYTRTPPDTVWTGRTIRIGAQTGTLTEGTAGTATFTVTTANINSGSAITLNNTNSVAGITLGTTATNGSSTDVSISITDATPQGTHPLTLTIDGVTSFSFNLTVNCNHNWVWSAIADPITSLTNVATITCTVCDETETATLQAYLQSLPANTADDPIPLKVKIGLGTMTSATSNWQELLGVLNTADKYVDLDLSGCTMAGTEFNPVYNFSTGKDKIVAITLPEAGRTITAGTTETSTFARFTSLASVTIPDGYTGIPASAFYGRTSLTSVTIGSGVTTIGREAFRGTGLTSVDIPDSVTTIGLWMFQDCTSLTSVTIGSGITNIVQGVFQDCSSLTDVTIGGSVTVIGMVAFQGCSSLKSVTIPDGVRTISNGAFSSCSGLTSIDIPTSVAGIETGAFADCSSLTSVTIPNGVRNILANTFSGCSSLTSVVLPNNLLSIYASAFQNCSSLTDVTIPASVTSIGDSAFYSCTSLESITIPFVGNTLNGTTNTLFGYIFGTTNITNQNNYIPTTLKTVIITGGTSIASQAFYGCTGLTSVTIPDSVTSIGDLAFQDCSSLASVTIPTGVTTIGASAFRYCTALTSVTIPTGVTSIGVSAFNSCSRLESVTFQRANTAFNATATNSGSFPNAASLQTAYTTGGIGEYTRDNTTVPIPGTVPWVKK